MNLPNKPTIKELMWALESCASSGMEGSGKGVELVKTYETKGAAAFWRGFKNMMEKVARDR